MGGQILIGVGLAVAKVELDQNQIKILTVGIIGSCLLFLILGLWDKWRKDGWE